jgi:hypothetical protein
VAVRISSFQPFSVSAFPIFDEAGTIARWKKKQGDMIEAEVDALTSLNMMR